MPAFNDIYNNYNTAKTQGLIDPDESLQTYAQKGFQLTGDPSYKNVADSGDFSLGIRSRSADLSNLINMTPVDEFTSELAGQVGDLFGVNPESSRATGKRLPRMAVDFLPMMAAAAAAPYTGGTSLTALGTGATAVLGALSGYEQEGKVTDALIGAAGPYAGNYLAGRGAQAATSLAARSPMLQRIGLTGGTKLTGQALTEAEKTGLGAVLTPETLAQTTATRTVLDKPLDKFFAYMGGQVAANAGFAGLDAVRHGREAVLNRDYLFNTVISNLPFAAVDVVQYSGAKEIARPTFQRPVAPEIFASPGEERAVRAAAMFAGVDDPKEIARLKKSMGLDIAQAALKGEELRAAIIAKKQAADTNREVFVKEWNSYLDQNPLARAAGFEPIQRGGAFGAELLNFDKAVKTGKTAPADIQAIVARYKAADKNMQAKYDGVVRNLAKPVSFDAALEKATGDLNLQEFMSKPVQERDYHTALKDSSLSLEGIDLVRDLHRFEAGLPPENPQLFKEFLDLYKGRPSKFTPDQRVDLAVAASLARGQSLRIAKARKEAQQAKQEGATNDEVINRALAQLENPTRQFISEDPKLQELEAKVDVDSAEADVTVTQNEINTLIDQAKNIDPVQQIQQYEQMQRQLQGLQARLLDQQNSAKQARDNYNEVLTRASTLRLTERRTPVEEAQQEVDTLTEQMKSVDPVKDISVPLERDLTKPEQLTPKERFNRSPIDVVRPTSLPLGASKKSTKSRLLDQFDKGVAWAQKNDSEKANLASFQKRNDLFKTRQRNGYFGTDKAAEDYAFWKGASAFFEVKQANLERKNEKVLSDAQKKAQHTDEILIAFDLKAPVSAAAVDAYGITLPKGYTLKGELYVFENAKKEESVLPVGEEPAIVPLTQRPAFEVYNAIVRSSLVYNNIQKARSAVESDLKSLTPAKKNELATLISNRIGTKVKVTELADEFMAEWRPVKVTIDPLTGMQIVSREDTVRLFAEDPDFVETREIRKSKKQEADQIDYARAEDKRGMEYMIPLPEGDFTTVEPFARTLLQNMVPAAELPAKSQELVELAKLFNNPEVAYAELGKLVPARQADVQFARASAGAFDFGMREVQNGKLIRLGKPPLGSKDGTLSEQEFRVNGGELGPLQKDEVEFYKQLVPEAFENGRVHLQKLWDGLSKVSEQVKVVTYGQDGEASVAKQQLDKLTDEWYDKLDPQIQAIVDSAARRGDVDSPLNNLARRAGGKYLDALNQDKLAQFVNLTKQVASEKQNYAGPRATSHYNQVSPFYTKKFPVLRVDVVLPEGKLWGQDKLHENLPNTLGWAMVQVVPHPVTGEKVMFVGELQSRWAQRAKKYGTKEPHPLLPTHQNLILKSVIKEAQKQGISKVAISDAESAMMTEGHDTSGSQIGADLVQAGLKPGDYVDGIRDTKGVLTKWRSGASSAEEFRGVELKPGYAVTRLTEKDFAPQSGGMRLAYDTTLPSIMSKLVGDGEMMDFGVHKNALSGETRIGEATDLYRVIDVDRITNSQRREAEQLGLTVEETSTGIRIYEENSSGFSDLVNRFATEQNLPTTLVDAFGQTFPDKQLKGSPIFRTPSGTPKTNVTAQVYDISNPSPRVDTLFAQNQEKIYGAASYAAKKIFINSKAFQGLQPAERLAFVFAHEHGHIAFRKALEGAYGQEAQKTSQEALDWVTTADPQARKVVEDVIRELHLPKEISQMDGVRDVLGNADPQEWLANALGMYAVGTVKANKPKLAFAMLPKPIRTFFEWTVRGMQNLYKGLQTWSKLGFDSAKVKQVNRIKDMLDSMRRSYRQAEWDAMQAEEFLTVQPEDMIAKMSDTQFARQNRPLGEYGKPEFKEQPKAWLWDKFNRLIVGLGSFANMNPAFKQPADAIFQSDMFIDNANKEVMKTIYGQLTSGNKVKISSPDFERVMGSEPLRKFFDRMMVHSQVKNTRLVTQDLQTGQIVLDTNALSPKLRGELQQFNPEAQQALASLLAKAEIGNKKTQDFLLAKDREGFVSRLALILVNRPSFDKVNDFSKAEQLAEGILTDYENARPDLAEQKLMNLEEFDRNQLLETTAILSKQYADLKAFYDSHPNYMSFRRFKAFKRRIKMGTQTDVIDASTPTELEALTLEKEAQGWKREGEIMRRDDKKTKDQYQMNDQLLELIRNHENSFRAHIDTLGLPDDVKSSLNEALNTVDIATREINGRELYRPMGTRQFKGDLERFNWLEQFMSYTPAALAAASKRALGAKINFWMQDPALTTMRTEKDQFMDLYRQSLTTDPNFWRGVNKANAVWHIGWNLPGHIAEVFQPVLSHVHELIAQGDSIPRATARLLKASKEMLKVQAVRVKNATGLDKFPEFKHGGQTYEGMAAAWLKANGTGQDHLEIARLLTEASGRFQRSPLSEVHNFVGEDQINLQRMVDGKKQASLSELAVSPFKAFGNAAMGFYSQFPMQNGVLALVSAYRQARAQGLSPDAAIKKAEMFDLQVNNSGGKLERPALFNQLGGAGHLVYALTSYVRGRFAELATYYRHGYDETQFGDLLTPQQKANARKAFKTMLLAQVAAAGLTGLPFINSGIALMEELTGEDIKGKMYEALDAVTEDPALTRVLTHGVATSFAESLGIPADMQSRFALSSFMGLNAYDGVSAKSFMGPSVAMLNSLWGLGGDMVQGKSLEEALTKNGPGGVKRLAEALSEDFQQQNPDANLFWSALGFRSSELTKRKELERIADKRTMAARNQLDLAAKRINQVVDTDPTRARQQMFKEAMELTPAELSPIERQAILQQTIKDLTAKVTKMQMDKVAPVDVRADISARVAPSVSNVARAMAYQPPAPMERARAIAQQRTRAALGQPLTTRPVRNAMMRDLQWSSNPFSF